MVRGHVHLVEPQTTQELFVHLANRHAKNIVHLLVIVNEVFNSFLHERGCVNGELN